MKLIQNTCWYCDQDASIPISEDGKIMAWVCSQKCMNEMMYWGSPAGRKEIQKDSLKLHTELVRFKL